MVASRGGRIHKFTNPEPLRIQQEEIQICSGSATFSILRSGSAPDPPGNNQTLVTTKRTKRRPKKNINRSLIKIRASLLMRTKKIKKFFTQNSGVFCAKFLVNLLCKQICYTPFGKVHLHIAKTLFVPIATVAAKLSFVRLLVELRKPSSFL